MKNPDEAESASRAVTALMRPVRTMRGPKPPESLRGRVRIASPTTPPRPLGRGQRSVAGSSPAKAAAKPTPTIHRTTRRPKRSSLRWFMRRRPQKPIGTITAVAAMPTICMVRSATMAPAPPSRLRTGPEVAWLKLGSCTDQVRKASASAPAKASNMSPQASASRFPRK